MAKNRNPVENATVTFVQGDSARLVLGGPLDFDSVSDVLDKVEQQAAEQSQTLSSSGQSLIIDLADVTSCNSAALALLVECKAIANRHSLQSSFVNVPAGVLQLAEVCEALPLLQA